VPGVKALLDAPAHQLARWIREKQVSALEVVDAHIERTRVVNPAINAVVVERYARAREEARAADARLGSKEDPNDLPPLLGVPYSAKEYIRVEGMPLSAGIWSRRDIRADYTAETIKRLQAAGAILLGSTNVPEGGLWMETYNDVYGRTVNPWNRGRAAGGSSGGDGAIVSSGGVAFALGADVGGSIRIPAAFCGTVGHKQSGRMVPNTGFWPEAVGEMNAYLVCGPLTRCVDDVMPLLRVLAGPDGVDPVCREFELGNPDEVEVDELVVYPCHDSGFTKTGKVNREVVDRATATLRRAGAQVRELDPKRLKQAFQIWSAMMASSGGPSYSTILGDGKEVRIGRELIKLGMGRSRHTLPALVIAGAEKITDALPGEVEKSIAAGRALQEELESILGPNGILLHPPYTSPAPRHYQAMARPFDFVRTGLFNVLEFPATVVPMGFDFDGLPLSVQCIGGRGRDHVTLAAAKVLEASHGGWRRATPSWRLDEELGPYSLVSN
jgi:fatty acid amide hydrolase 2